MVHEDGSMLLESTGDRFLIWSVFLLIIAACSLVCFFISRNRHVRKYSLLAFSGTLVLALIIIPATRSEYIHVSGNNITIEQGIWFRDSKRVLHFHNLDKISEQSHGFLPGNLLGDPDVSWHFSWEDGSKEELDLNDFFNAHRMVVAYYIKDRGYRLERLEEQLHK